MKLCGGLLCGWISDPIGRKKAMILANLPVLVSWYYFYYSTSTTELFIANGLLGFSSGFLKMPCISYVSEISQPTIRGILVSSSTVSTTVAPLLIFLLATMTTWRHIALYACALQLLTLAVLFLVSMPIFGCFPNPMKFNRNDIHPASAIKNIDFLLDTIRYQNRQFGL